MEKDLQLPRAESQLLVSDPIHPRLVDEAWRFFDEHKEQIATGVITTESLALGAIAFGLFKKVEVKNLLPRFWRAGEAQNHLGMAEGMESLIRKDHAPAFFPISTGNPLKEYGIKAVVSKLKAHDIPITKTNIEFTQECILANSGKFDVLHTKLSRAISEATESSSAAPHVLNTFVRIEAERYGIAHSKLETAEVLKQLDKVASSSDVVHRVVNLNRMGGGFNDRHLVDPLIARLLMEKSSDPLTIQAINVSARNLGSVSTFSREPVAIARELLANGAHASSIDYNTLLAANALDYSRRRFGTLSSEIAKIKISPSNVRTVLSHMGHGYDPAKSEVDLNLIKKIANPFRGMPN